LARWLAAYDRTRGASVVTGEVQRQRLIAKPMLIELIPHRGEDGELVLMIQAHADRRYVARVDRLVVANDQHLRLRVRSVFLDNDQLEKIPEGITLFNFGEFLRSSGIVIRPGASMQIAVEAPLSSNEPFLVAMRMSVCEPPSEDRGPA
jgi:hypothetical protein